MATFGARLDSMRWSAQEKGWINEWRELKRLADAPANALLTLNDPHGDIDYTANCEPDIAQIKADEEVGRTGIGDAQYPAAKFPSTLAGFGS